MPDPDLPFGQQPQNVDVGEFRQGSAFSQWALARYLVGRAIVESVGLALLAVFAVLVVLAALAWFGIAAKVVAVLLFVIAVGVLLMRWVLLGIVRRLTGFSQYGPLEDRMKSLVDDTSSDVLSELRRIGLPGRIWTLPVLAVRFLGRDRRRDTLTRLKSFEVERAVPKARLDEMHIVMRTAFRSGDGPARPPVA